ncbi:hypothetical protein I3760_05G212500 [Carya illinoinensis]|nr:hypothetical protein I3760_05G212500 [Carya illinoinensis]
MNEKQRCVKEKSHLPKAKHVRGRGLEQIWGSVEKNVMSHDYYDEPSK